MDSEKVQFWRTKSLDQLTQEEWELLCDGCGICCMEKVENEETGTIEITSVSCQFLDLKTCRCMVYNNRLQLDPDCIKLSPNDLKEINWLPDTCAYRRLSEGRDLEWWHPLISGSPKTVHQEGISVQNRAVNGKYVHPDDILRNNLLTT